MWLNLSESTRDAYRLHAQRGYKPYFIHSNIGTVIQPLYKHHISLHRDAVASVLLQEWPLSANMFDGEVLEGPVPRLFTSSLDDAKSNFTTHLDLAYKDISRLMAKLFIPENLSPLNALAYLHNPK